MNLHDLRPAPGSKKTKKRVGRGVAAGQGKTAGLYPYPVIRFHRGIAASRNDISFVFAVIL